MSVRIIFIFAVMLLPGRLLAQGIDSTQWPFPDTIWVYYSASGDISDNGTILNLQNGMDSSWSSDVVGNIAFPSQVPFMGDPPPFFTRNDVQTNDSGKWHLAQGFGCNSTLDMLLDTNTHTILSFESYQSCEGFEFLQLVGLHYSRVE